MKKLNLLIVIAFTFQTFCYSQPCLPEGITFSTQAQIDNFQVNYPGCTEIEGDVLIGTNILGDSTLITNLNGLNVLTIIGGDLTIAGNYSLTSLSGLANLDSIGGTLNIGIAVPINPWFTSPIGNPSLIDLSGLNGLSFIEVHLYIHGNDSLTSLIGLENLTSIGGRFLVSLNEELTSLTGLNNLTSIGEGLWIGCSGLVSLTGLENLTSIPGDLKIGWGCGSQGPGAANYNLVSLAALNNITTIGGSLVINFCHTLTSLNGLGNLTSIGEDLSIGCNDSLTSLNGLGNLTFIGESLGIGHNDALTSLTGIEGALTSFGGGVGINDNDALTNLTGLEILTSIETLYIGSNDSLTSLTALENLTTIVGSFSVYGNKSLTSLTGLNNLSSVGRLYIDKNDALSSLTGLENLTSVESDIHIGGNYPNWWGNPSLVTLSGIDNIDAGTIEDIKIHNNNSLASCEVQSICDYLASPNGEIIIGDNAPGCNSQEEVEEACEAVDVADIIPDTDFLIYPNPATDELFIESRNKVKITGITIYNPIGQIVIKRKGIPERIDISTLNQGVYFLELVTNETKIKKKLIVN